MKFSSSSEEVISFSQEQRLLLIIVLLLSAFTVGRSQAEARSFSTPPAAVSTYQVPDSCPSSLNFDGVYEQGLGWGASAIIGGYQPKMWCSDTSMWSMILNPNYGSSNGYAQIGYLRSTLEGSNDTVNEYFTEYTDTSGPPQLSA